MLAIPKRLLRFLWSKYPSRNIRRERSLLFFYSRSKKHIYVNFSESFVSFLRIQIHMTKHFDIIIITLLSKNKLFTSRR
ncbi:CLUMA_CG009115, isoform A [Clunio marinus]|uniref:CLUMA_CG009115, isoform A n=1 Tax=Clunio marinus TaxID=568069 RepID=A0A1J1IB39_9DIPT|nr:CLUMA_CG009115, isoform A [Clunio marinus]